MAAKQAGLIEGTAERWADAWNGPAIAGEVSQPVEQRFVVSASVMWYRNAFPP